MQNLPRGWTAFAHSGRGQFNCTECGFKLRHFGLCKDCFDGVSTDVKKLEEGIENQQTINEPVKEALQNLEEEVEFLRKWNSTPAEASGTGDVTILCTLDGSLLHADSCILSNKSDVFCAILEEKDVKEKETKQVQIDGAGGESVKAFLKFLYSAQVSEEDKHAHFRELVKLAHFYQVKSLIDQLDNFLSDDKGKDLSIEVIKMAYLYDLEKTRFRVQHRIVNDDPDNELFDIAFKELQVDNPGIAHQFSGDIIRYMQLRPEFVHSL